MTDIVTISNIFEDVKMSTLSRGDKFFLNGKEYTFQKGKWRRLPKIARTFIFVCFEVQPPCKERWFTRDHTITAYINRNDK